ncbi:hypothetical protein PAUR_a1183 [Pseudoalteromonas aurantia 208]|uniref:Uncharacterized protein n=1 Tax=Pseudoalteromonas aurantia 208 TaxID=1314867 RepID=A0ABR9E9U5_9GAMM|nr:hypothetical protein [Pseudoalteromonas aurantia 208]
MALFKATGFIIAGNNMGQAQISLKYAKSGSYDLTKWLIQVKRL